MNDNAPKLKVEEPASDLKLVLHDSPQIVEKKSAAEPPLRTTQKRILIAKEVPK